MINYISIFDCPVCQNLKDRETAFHKYGWDVVDIPFPEAVNKLQPIKPIENDYDKVHHIKQCQICGCLYSYEFNNDYYPNGNEDEEILLRLAPCDSKSSMSEEEYNLLIDNLLLEINSNNPAQRKYSAKSLASHYIENNDFTRIELFLRSDDSEIQLGILGYLMELITIKCQYDKIQSFKPLFYELLSNRDLEIRKYAFNLLKRGFKTTIYKSEYSDYSGKVRTEILYDGKKVYLNVDGYIFCGSTFDGFEIMRPPEGINFLPDRFTLNRNDLCDCTLTFEIPVILVWYKKDKNAILKCTLVLGKPADRGSLDKQELSIELHVGKTTIKTIRIHDLFEYALQDIQSQLGRNKYYKNCFGCLYSDYFVAGQTLWGNMFCFRNIKEAYLKVKSKDDYMEIMDQCIEFVPETHLCEEFVKRKKGTGYRK